MASTPKNRKSDQYALAKQIWAGVASALIVIMIVGLWNFPSVYAKKTDLAETEEKCDTNAQAVNEKLDKILDIAGTLDKRSEIQAVDIQYIKLQLAEEIIRSKGVDAEHTKKIEENRDRIR